HGAYGTVAADLDDDGYCDLLICNSYQDSSYLYWGGKDGFSVAHRQSLKVGSALSAAAADLNHDGFLDLTFVGTTNGKNLTTILWGSAAGFADDRKTVLELKTRRCANVAGAD